MEDGNLHGAPQLFLDEETFGRFDIFEVDAAEGRLEQLARADDLLWILGGQLDIEDVDIGETLEQHGLAFHHGLAGEGSDIAQSKHGRAVGHHPHQVALTGVLVRELRIALDGETGNRNARSVRQAQIALCQAGLGRADRDLPRGRRGMVFERIFVAQIHYLP